MRGHGADDWDDWASLGGLRAVLDPRDSLGFKNRLLDSIHWHALRAHVRSGRVLDFGCGNGRFANRLVALGVDYRGVDGSPQMIEYARSLSPDLASRFACLQQDCFPFEGGTFDTCLSVIVLQYLMHTEDCECWIAEMHRVVRPGGRLVLLEQATRCGPGSSSVLHPSTESDYLDALGDRFRVESIRVVRLGSLSRVSHMAITAALRAPWLWPVVQNSLTLHELRRARRAGKTDLDGLSYYEILVIARRL
jgi:SAM-dependent methyltransferase